MNLEQQAAVGVKAPDFSLPDSQGNPVSLAQILAKGPAILAFYPKDFGMVCTKQLCAYQDRYEEFAVLGVQIVGISANDSRSHGEFASKYQFSFPLLSDPGRKVTRTYGATSLLMFGGTSRAVFIVNRNGVLVYRYVEPTTATARKPDELIKIVKGLKDAKKI